MILYRQLIEKGDVMIMKNIILQVNYKKYNISMENDVYFAFNYMDNIKDMKKRCRYAILNNEYDREYTITQTIL